MKQSKKTPRAFTDRIPYLPYTTKAYLVQTINRLEQLLLQTLDLSEYRLYGHDVGWNAEKPFYRMSFVRVPFAKFAAKGNAEERLAQVNQILGALIDGGPQARYKIRIATRRVARTINYFDLSVDIDFLHMSWQKTPLNRAIASATGAPEPASLEIERGVKSPMTRVEHSYELADLRDSVYASKMAIKNALKREFNLFIPSSDIQFHNLKGTGDHKLAATFIARTVEKGDITRTPDDHDILCADIRSWLYRKLSMYEEQFLRDHLKVSVSRTLYTTIKFGVSVMAEHLVAVLKEEAAALRNKGRTTVATSTRRPLPPTRIDTIRYQACTYRRDAVGDWRDGLARVDFFGMHTIQFIVDAITGERIESGYDVRLHNDVAYAAIQFA